MSASLFKAAGGWGGPKNHGRGREHWEMPASMGFAEAPTRLGTYPYRKHVAIMGIACFFRQCWPVRSTWHALQPSCCLEVYTNCEGHSHPPRIVAFLVSFLVEIRGPLWKQTSKSDELRSGIHPTCVYMYAYVCASLLCNRRRRKVGGDSGGCESATERVLDHKAAPFAFQMSDRCPCVRKYKFQTSF